MHEEEPYRFGKEAKKRDMILSSSLHSTPLTPYQLNVLASTSISDTLDLPLHFPPLYVAFSRFFFLCLLFDVSL